MGVHHCEEGGCGCDCQIGTDPFDTDLSQWTTSGSVSVAGGLLVMSGASTAIFDSVPNSADDGVHIETTPQTTDATATVDLICARSDADNYLFGRFAKSGGAATLQLFKREGGVNTALTDTVTVEDTGSELDARGTLELCWQPGEAQEGEELEVGGLLPTDVTQDNVAGEADWIDLGEVTQQDGVGATSTLSAGGETLTRTLVARGFGFNVPAGSTITGVGLTFSARNEILAVEARHVKAILIWPDGGSDNIAENAIVSDENFAEISVGGEGELWGTGGTLTWEDANHPLFSVGIQFDWDENHTSTTIEVDWISLTLFYTTPDRGRGRLTLAYTNTGSATVDCVTDRSVFAPTEGLGNGIAVQSGDLDFGAYTLSYLNSDIRPDCPDCDCTVDEAEPCECCDEPAPAAEYIADLGAGGWTDKDDCGWCDEIGGTYLLSPVSSCQWSYAESVALCADDGTTCGIPDPADTVALLLSLVDDGGGGCKWVLVVHLEYSPGGAAPCRSNILYEAALASDTECQEPVTLTYVSGDWTPYCNGTAPATIDLEPA